MAGAGTTIPSRAGVGLKACHYHDILGDKPDIGWFEVHAENFMGAGGPPHAYLSTIRASYPLSLHGVGLSIGGIEDLDLDHLDRLKALVDRYQPALFSEHLAWSSHRTAFFNDLLAVPYTDETLDLVCAHVDQVQSHLNCKMLLENPATYVVFETSTYDEVDYLSEIARRTGCGLLLDVNNVYVSCINHGRDAADYIDRFPAAAVGEIHLAGHGEDRDDEGERLLIDSHDRPVIDPVWELYGRTLARTGAQPTLIEWDNNIPEWSELFAQAHLANSVMTRTLQNCRSPHVA